MIFHWSKITIIHLLIHLTRSLTLTAEKPLKKIMHFSEADSTSLTQTATNDAFTNDSNLIQTATQEIDTLLFKGLSSESKTDCELVPGNSLEYSEFDSDCDVNH